MRVGMVMAAGLGTRMGALTRDLPKPLLRVRGRTLLDHALDRLAVAGVERAVVNVHYLAPLVRAHLAGRTRPVAEVSDETAALLDTGGGLRRAAPRLGEAPALVANSDAIWAGAAPLAGLAAAWDDARMDALLQLVPRERARAYTRAGDFLLAPDGRPERRGARAEAPFVYAGAQAIRPSLALEGPEGAFSANLLWDLAASRGRLFAMVHDGDWVDVGTPEGLAAAEALA